MALVFNGTLHLEFTLLGVPVIATGNSVISGMDFDKKVKSLKNYKYILTKKNYNFKKLVSKNKKKLKTFSFFWFIKRIFKWEKNNYYPENFNRFKYFKFKFLSECNFNTLQNKRLLDYILKGKIDFK